MQFLLRAPPILYSCVWFVLQCDRMAVDCAIELEDSNVAMVSLWPMAVKTELCMEMAAKDSKMVRLLATAKMFNSCTKCAGTCYHDLKQMSIYIISVY